MQSQYVRDSWQVFVKGADLFGLRGMVDAHEAKRYEAMQKVRQNFRIFMSYRQPYGRQC
jgi:hypothetical protein